MLAFYAFYPLVLYLLIFNGYAYFLMPGFGITSDFLNKSYLYFIFFDLLIIPTFVALSKLRKRVLCGVGFNVAVFSGMAQRHA